MVKIQGHSLWGHFPKNRQTLKIFGFFWEIHSTIHNAIRTQYNNSTQKATVEYSCIFLEYSHCLNIFTRIICGYLHLWVFALHLRVYTQYSCLDWDDAIIKFTKSWKHKLFEIYKSNHVLPYSFCKVYLNFAVIIVMYAPPCI